MNNFLLSVIIPIYNEEKSLPLLLKRVLPVLKKYDYELIFVDDGSIDNTSFIIKKESKKNLRIKFVSFYRNFGHQAALSCGYQLAKGNCVITMDSDLQDTPEILPRMIIQWQQGSKIVYAQRKIREGESFIKRVSANLFYRCINFLSDTPIPQEVGDFRLLDREVVSFLNTLPEQSRFLRGLVAWGNFPASYVTFKREKRTLGTTHYPFSKMVNLALEGITSFSIKPLRVASYLGFASASAGFIGIIYAIVGRIFLPDYWVTGWTALFVGIMFLGGIQLITIGIIGEYVGKIYREIQHRPQYLIKEKVNLSGDTELNPA